MAGRPRGRPMNSGLYDPAHHPRIAEAMARMGATEWQIAEVLGVSRQTVSHWTVQYPEFGVAMNKGILESFSPKIVRSLAQQALGYPVDIEEARWDPKEGKVQRWTVRKWQPANVTACIFWLKNRDPENWRDVRDYVVEHNSLDKLTSKQLLEEIRSEAKRLGVLDTPEFSSLKEDTEESKKSIKH